MIKMSVFTLNYKVLLMNVHSFNRYFRTQYWLKPGMRQATYGGMIMQPGIF